MGNKIDRKRLVTRHNPFLTAKDEWAPFNLGNGQFAFTADFTGLQTFPEDYKVPLGTQSHWGWHSSPGKNHYTLEDFQFDNYRTEEGTIPYPVTKSGQEEVFDWLRQNPHRMQLGRLRFIIENKQGKQLDSSEVKAVEQTLNIWEGILYSTFQAGEETVQVITFADAEKDTVHVKVVSDLLTSGQLKLGLDFYGQEVKSSAWEEEPSFFYQESSGHSNQVLDHQENYLQLKRTVGDTSYFPEMQWSSGILDHVNEHSWVLTAGERELECSLQFSEKEPRQNQSYSFEKRKENAKDAWQKFWENGAALELYHSKDKRAKELERRIVLSQYLTAVHSAGKCPPQETGLFFNSWFGKFHLEMHWWHAAHFPVWNRADHLKKSLPWYRSILSEAKELAASQGYQGARWPKQVGPEGRQSPSPISPLLIWQQPHPIALCELVYLAEPSDGFLNEYKEIVYETADFMADFVIWEEDKKQYSLKGPLIPAQENHKPQDVKNPAFELEYWAYGLKTAILWAERKKEAVPEKWKKVLEQLAPLPVAGDVYLAHENCRETFTKFNTDHPSMTAAFGVLNGSKADEKIMKNTLLKVKECWEWDTAWGWDFPMCAMTAARLGEKELAVEFLLMDLQKNTYLVNGHNYQRPELSAYLPGNGGLLTAVGLMAAGSQTLSYEGANGFPDDGTWKVQAEGFLPVLP